MGNFLGRRFIPASRLHNFPATGATHWSTLEAIQREIRDRRTEALNRISIKELRLATNSGRNKLLVERVKDLLGSGLLIEANPRVKDPKVRLFRLTPKGAAISSAEELDVAFRQARGEVA